MGDRPTDEELMEDLAYLVDQWSQKKASTDLCLRRARKVLELWPPSPARSGAEDKDPAP